MGIIINLLYFINKKKNIFHAMLNRFLKYCLTINLFENLWFKRLFADDNL